MLAAGCGAGALLWWLFFRSGINRTVLVVCVVGLAALLFPNVKLPVNNRLAWGGSMALAILVALLLGPRFGVPPLAGVGIAVFMFLVVLAAMNIETVDPTEEEIEEEIRKFWKDAEHSRQLDEDLRRCGRGCSDD